MKVTSEELPELLTRTMQVGIVPFIHSSPATGKSRIIKQLNPILHKKYFIYDQTKHRK